MKTTIYVVILLLFCMGCKTTSEKTAVMSAQVQQTKALLDSGTFEIDFNWANPMASSEMNQLGAANLLGIGSTANRINLIGNTNYMRFENDSLSVYLPYYGTRQVGTQLGSESLAIQFEGVPMEYEVAYQEAKQRTKFEFEMKDDSEYYNVYMTVYGSGRALVQVTSSQRTPISYEGVVQELQPDN